jgi:hypothetical protein
MADVRHEVRERVQVLGRQGGYIMASSHHIQSDTPLANIFAMYDVALRYRKEDAVSGVWQPQSETPAATVSAQKSG